jgi:transcriptional regulator GlxA family with amidase domain
MNIAFILFPDFEELDFAGPWEVFGMAAKYVAKDWRPYTVAAQPVVRGFLGMRVEADHTFESAPAADVIVVPGGFGTRPGMTDERLVGFIRASAATSRLVTSVCTGALLLQAAGLLEGRRATTHWAARKELADLGGVTLEDARYVYDGNVITAAGVSAGIDMALYVVGQLTSPGDAKRVQKAMEYEPDPPYADVPLPGA